MPTIPENKFTETIGSGKWNSFNPNVPVVHSISSDGLLKMGFVKESESFLPHSQTKEIVYKRGDDKIIYNGCQWLYKGRIIQFFEDIV